MKKLISKTLLSTGLLALALSCEENKADYKTRSISPVPAPTTLQAREAEGNGTAKTEEVAVFVAEAAPEVTEALAAQGKTIYLSNCISCHNQDPRQSGSLGPSQYETPWEVFKVKVVTGRYPKALPPGYSPLRTTKAMRKFPDLEGDLPALWSYIKSFK
jgi:mono/diheme cytochrome c family protein